MEVGCEMDRQCLYLEVEPTGLPDRLDMKSEGKRRIEVCGLNDWMVVVS